MTPFQMSLVAIDKLLFAENVDQVDLPGAEGDFGVMAGHVPIVASLRPGFVSVFAEGACERFVVFGGLAEFSDDQLTVLAEKAWPADDMDVDWLTERIDEMQNGLSGIPAQDEQTLALLVQYKSILVSLTSTKVEP